MPNTTVSQIVGVQPMRGPSGLIFNSRRTEHIHELTCNCCGYTEFYIAYNDDSRHVDCIECGEDGIFIEYDTVLGF